MTTETIPEPWASFLSELDSRVNEGVELHCLGGFVVTMVYGLPRATADVDVITISPIHTRLPLLEAAGRGSELHQKYGIYLDFVTIVNLPEDYDLRLTDIFPDSFRNLRLYALDPYDVALAKLERNIQRDRDDVKYLARTVPLNPELLRERFERELRPYLGNPEREANTLRLWIEAIEEERKSLPDPSNLE